ncbi:uncharacterized protein LOC134565359 isoform X2 [Prinia subflava]|uniref:uncharacterized protein LOC134565359 isoform X2 n=1 Tax=Prinia subflava TaxID=208062 RepID=UPI002FE30352
MAQPRQKPARLPPALGPPPSSAAASPGSGRCRRSRARTRAPPMAPLLPHGPPGGGPGPGLLPALPNQRRTTTTDATISQSHTASPGLCTRPSLGPRSQRPPGCVRGKAEMRNSPGTGPGPRRHRAANTNKVLRTSRPAFPSAACSLPPAPSKAVLEVLVAVIATLGELAAVVAGSDEDVLRAESRESLRGPLRKFTWTLRCTLRRHHVTPPGHRGVTPLGQALTALEATPGATWANVRAAVRAWQNAVDALAEIWLWVVEKAAELRRSTQNFYWSGQPAEVAKGLLWRLVAACDKATVFPWELLRRLRDIEAALEETREVSPYVPEALVAAVAEAEQLWEASTCLTTRHLLGTLADICALLSSHPDVPGGHAVAEQCQRAIKDIPRLLRTQQENGVSSKDRCLLRDRAANTNKVLRTSRPAFPSAACSLPPAPSKAISFPSPDSPRRIPACPRLSPGPVRLLECPQSVPGVLPAAMEPRELLEALVAVVATLGNLLAIVTGPDRDRLPTMFPNSVCAELRKFTWHLCCTLNHRGVTSLGQCDVTSLRQALATLEANPGPPWARVPVTAAVSAWQESVAALTESWDRLAGEATKLHDNCRTKGTWSEQGQMALRLLGHLVSLCDRATVFLWELLRRLGDIEATLVETREVSPSVPKALVAAVAETEQLWEASTPPDPTSPAGDTWGHSQPPRESL